MPAHVLSYPPPSWGKDTRTVLLFFIPGNPGYIGYYEPFLLCLRSLIDSSNGSRSKSAEFHICGQDLAGFNDDDHEPFSSSHQPHNVQYQIDYYLKVLSGLRIPDGPKKGKSYDDIVLMGHSLGTYIALQLFQAVLKDPEPQLHLKSGILLFATVEHLADSPRGKRLDLLRRSPFLSRNAHVIAKAFLSLWPYSALYWYVSTIMGFPKHAATVTTQFLKSRDGVWQALYMGLDELNVIGEGDWDETLWEIAEEAQVQTQINGVTTPKFCFFFGRNDTWVANHLRDEFIKRRSQDVGTKLVVDEGNIPHDFCIHHSEAIAEKANTWINEMYA